MLIRLSSLQKGIKHELPSVHRFNLICKKYQKIIRNEFNSFCKPTLQIQLKVLTLTWVHVCLPPSQCHQQAACQDERKIIITMYILPACSNHSVFIDQHVLYNAQLLQCSVSCVAYGLLLTLCYAFKTRESLKFSYLMSAPAIQQPGFADARTTLCTSRLFSTSCITWQNHQNERHCC